MRRKYKMSKYKLLIFIFIFIFIHSIFYIFSDTQNKNNLPILRLETQGHNSVIRNAKFTSDGKKLVTCSEDKTIRIWDTQTGELLKVFRGYINIGFKGMFFSIAVDPKNRYLAAGGWLEGTSKRDAIRIYDLKTGNLLKLIFGHRNVTTSILFSPDGAYLATASFDGDVKIWRVSDFSVMKTIRHHGNTYGLSFSKDSQYLASASNDKSIIVTSLRTFQIVAEKKDAHKKPIFSISFSPNNKYLVTDGMDGKINLWEAKDLKFIKTLKRVILGSLTSTKFIDDSTIISGGSHNINYNEKNIHPIYIIDINNRKPEKIFLSHTDTIMDIDTFNDKNTTLIASISGNKNEVYIWDPVTLKILQTIQSKGKDIFGIGFGKNGNSIYFGNIKDGISREATHSIEKKFNLKEKHIESAKDNNYIKPILEFKGMKLKISGNLYDRRILVGNDKMIMLPVPNDTPRCYSFTPDGKYIIIGSSFGLYRVNSKTLKIDGEFKGHEGVTWGVVVSPDSKTLLSGGGDQTLRLWDIQSLDNKKVINPIITIFIGNDDEWIAFNPDGYYESSLDGAKYAGWHFNRGENREAEFYTLEQYRSIFYRPDVIELALNRKYIDLPKISFDTKPPVISTLKINEKEIYDEKEIVIEIKNPEFNIFLESTGEYELSHPELFYNGRIISQSSYKGEPEVSFKDNYKKLSANYTFHVTAKESNYKILTIDEKGFASKEKKVKVIYNGKDATPAFYKLGEKVKYPSPENTLHVISIGINDYTNLNMKKAGLNDLNFAEKDAFNISELLASQEGKFYESVDVILLTKGQKGRDIIKKDVLRALKSIGKKLEENDSIILFISGHGLRLNNNYYLLTSECDPSNKETLNNTSVSWNDIGETLKSFNNAKEIVVILDACHSGMINMIELGNKWKNKGITLFASCKGSQQSYEDAKTMNGYFTKALVEGFTKLGNNKNTPADFSKDDVLIIGEVLNYAIQKVGEWSGGRQTPWVPAYDPAIEGKIMGVAK
jgi:WD40 repeat protein